MPLKLNSAEHALDLGFEEGKSWRQNKALPENLEESLRVAIADTHPGTYFLDNYRDGFRAGYTGLAKPRIK